jgi:outer membrane receptor protein involved in Fe transport
VLRADVNLSDTLTLTSITDYTDVSVNFHRDVDGTAFDVMHQRILGDIHSLNQELRLSGHSPDNMFTYVLGVNGQTDSGHEAVVQQLYANYSTLPKGLTFDTHYDVSNRSGGVFGNIDVKLARTLTLVAGARYTADRQTLKGCSYDSGDGTFAALDGGIAAFVSGDPTIASFYTAGACATVGDVGPTPTYRPYFADFKRSEHNISWRAGLNYRPTSATLVYGVVSRGYKAGGFPVQNTLLASQYNSIKQEQLTAYEVGVKTTIARIFDLSGSLFYYDYKNKQFYGFTFVPPLGPLPTELNVPKGKAKGIDLEATLRPTDGLRLHGTLTYVDSKIGNYSAYEITGASIVGLKGNSFNYAPRWSGAFDADYRFPLAARLTGVINLGGQFASKSFGDLAHSPQIVMKSYTTLDAGIGVEADNWGARLWARNLTNSYYLTNAFLAADTVARYTGAPRTFGISAHINY